MPTALKGGWPEPRPEDFWHGRQRQTDDVLVPDTSRTISVKRVKAGYGYGSSWAVVRRTIVRTA